MVDTDAKRAAGRGLAGGVAAWILGYLVVYLLHGSSIQNSFGSDLLEAFTGEPVTWKLVGWLFFNAHNVAVTVPGFLGESAWNFVARSDQAAALFVLPPVLLVLAGFAAAWNAADAPTTAARNGAAVVLGYLPLSVAGAVLFTIGSEGATAGPTLLTAVLLAGAVYPLLFGAVGGLAGGHLSAE